jgi:biopolymer transport protein TolR
MPTQQKGKGRRLMGEINVVPYIDVMLVLLIIFMITAPLMTQGVKVELPKAGAKPLDQPNEQPLVLSVNRQGQIFLNRGTQEEKNRALDDDAVVAGTREALVGHEDLQVLVKADTAVAYGRVVEAMVMLQRAGVRKIGFITDPPPIRRR